MSTAKVRMIARGAVVKVRTALMFEHDNERRNKAPWVYGVVDHLDDVCEDTKERSWSISWATEHLYVTLENFLTSALSLN